jgi:general secretion pathway protein B
MSYILDALKRAEAERNAGRDRPALPAAFVASRPAPIPALKFLLWGALAVPAALTAAFFLFRAAPSDYPQAASAVAKLSEPDRATAAPATLASALPPMPSQVASAAVATPTAAGSARALPPAEPSARPSELGTLRDLPEQVQREIPPLVIGGYLYSSNPSERTVLINNRLRHEGDEVAPGLRLESLLANGMVLRYREYRYRSTY